MELTLDQVRTQLGISKERVKALEQSGTLVPVNQRNPGAGKWFRRYDSKQVDELRREMRAAAAVGGTGIIRRRNGHAPEPVPFGVVGMGTVSGGAEVVPQPAVRGAMTEVLGRLDRIEAALQQLLKLWG